MACQGLMKIFLLILNGIFFVIGGATLGIGVWVKVDKKQLLALTKDVSGADLEQTDVSSLLGKAVNVLITAGAFLFAIAFLGCCGTANNKTALGKFFLKLYSTVVLILLILELGGLTVAWFFFDKVENKLKEYLDVSLHTRYNGSFTPGADDEGFIYTSGGDAITLAWDVVQLQYECCGRENGVDYTNETILWYPHRDIELSTGEIKKLNVPPTCCAVNGGSKDLITIFQKAASIPEFTLKNSDCPYLPANNSVKGCYDEVKKDIKAHSVIFISIGVSTLGVQLFSVVFSCCLAKRDHDQVDKLVSDNDADNQEDKMQPIDIED